MQLNLWLHAVNVSIVARELTPALITHDYLVDREVVPKEWKMLENKNVSDVATSIIYDNQITLELDRRRVSISEICASSLESEHKIFDVTVRYLRQTSCIPYHTISFKWDILTELEGPQAWIHKCYLNPDRELPGNFYLEPRFIVDIGGEYMQLSFRVVDISRHDQDQTSEGLLMEGIVEFTDISGVDQIVELTKQWRRYQNAIKESIETILGSV